MKKGQKQTRATRVVGYYLLGVMAGILGMIAMARLIWHSKYYPNVVIGSVAVGGMSREQAKKALVEELANTSITLTYNGYSWHLPASAVPVNIDESLNQAYRVGRRLDLRDYALVFVAKPQIFPLTLGTGSTKEYEATVEEIAQAIEIPIVPTELKVVKGEVMLVNGSDGLGMDGSTLAKEVGEQLSKLVATPIAIPTRPLPSQLRAEEQEMLLTRANTLLSKTLSIKFEDEVIKLNGQELISYLDTSPETEEVVNQNAVTEYTEGLAESMDRQPVDAKFGFESGKVSEFAASKDGIKVKVEETSKKIAETILLILQENSEKKTSEVEVVAEHTSPAVTIDKINELGIKERIGRGESYYAHSIPNRIYNVGLASSRINSALIGPGEEVSFNKLVGEVSAATGYRSAYIISQGRTILGDGGGLCQVSTTLFRAAMNAGLPILERWGHSYRVSYYELNSKPGVDATVIAPSRDFRFKNDTPGHILIQTINDPKNLHLVIEIYGTDDGRVATVTEPKVWGITPPLPTVYQDDPSLPSGTVKQVDWAAGGARTSFEYKVTRNGETLQEQTFSTVYRPWAAVYLRGTGM